MQSHSDQSHFLDSLSQKAQKMVQDKKSEITAGKEGERPPAEWKAEGFSVRQLPDDEHGILRISIGGCDTPVSMAYLVFRGSHGQCVDLLRKAIKAIEQSP